MPDEQQSRPPRRVVINIARWQQVLGVMVAILALGAALWGGAAWAIDYQAGLAIETKLKDANLVRVQELNNMNQLLDLRLSIMEKRINEMSDRVEYMYRRELERSNNDNTNPSNKRGSS